MRFRIFGYFKGNRKERVKVFLDKNQNAILGPAHTKMRRSTHCTGMLKSSISDFHFIKISN